MGGGRDLDDDEKDGCWVLVYVEEVLGVLWIAVVVVVWIDGWMDER